jgi:hypothetical protein
MRRHPTSRHYPGHSAPQTDYPTRTCGERSRTIVILSERSESKDLSLPSRRHPGHSSAYSHASAPPSTSPRNLCVLCVSALDCSSLGFFSTFNFQPSTVSSSHPLRSLCPLWQKFLPSLSRHSPLATFSYLLYFQLLPHSFALIKNATLLFSVKSALFAQNTRGWGTESETEMAVATGYPGGVYGRRQETKTSVALLYSPGLVRLVALPVRTSTTMIGGVMAEKSE